MKAFAKLFVCLIFATAAINAFAWLFANVCDATRMGRHKFETPMREIFSAMDRCYPACSVVLIPYVKINQVVYFRESWFKGWLAIIVIESMVVVALASAIVRIRLMWTSRSATR